MPIQGPDKFVTPRLVLRRPRLEDAPAIFEAYARDPDVTRYLTFQPNKSAGDSQAWLQICLQHWETGEEFVWLIVLPADDRPIGSISCRVKDWKAEMGYALAKCFWNQGLMTEAVRAVADWALSCEGVFRISAYCDTANPASARVMEKAGL